MTLVASALAGGDCIDDADALRAGRTACALDDHRLVANVGLLLPATLARTSAFPNWYSSAA